jgi:hypothetical protein
MATEKDETVVIPSNRPKEMQPVSVMPPAPLTPQEQEYQAIARQNGIATPAQKSWAEQQMEASNVVNGQQQQLPADQGQQAPGTQQQPTWLEDWGGGKSWMEIAKSSKHPIGSLISDYNKWAQANGKDPLDYWEYAGLFMENDPTKSVQENEKEKKRKQWEDAFEHLGDVMMTFGNFVGAAGGAPAPDNIVDPKKLTETQRRRREAAENQRRAYNKDLLANMFKQREDNYRRDKNKADIGLIQERIRASQATEKRNENYNNARIEHINQQTEALKAKTPEEIKRIQAQTNASNASAEASIARRNNINKSSYGTDYKNRRHAIWSRNKSKHPAETEAFMKENNIHGYDKKNWTPELIDQFNSDMANLEAGGQTPSGGTTTDWSQYKVNK